VQDRTIDNNKTNKFYCQNGNKIFASDNYLISVLSK